ncbi:MAG: hypothetical protein JEZ05_06335 [Tenericutes bacterium]|nr:hypothetical protein [Mycoplasmatota bacterium]
MKAFIEKLQDTYTNLYDNKKALKKWLIAIVVIISIYQIINSYLNYDFKHFIDMELLLGLYVFFLVLFCRLFHEAFGKWYIHATRERLSIKYVKTKMPRKFKTDGDTGAGKDSTMNAIKKHFRDDLIEKIEDDLEYIEMICYPYDINKLNDYLDIHHEEFMTNIKTKFFSSYIDMMKINNCFIKKYYSKDFNTEEHLKELYSLQKNPFDPDLKIIKFQYNDLIQPRHYLSLLIKYCMLYIRINYMNYYVVTNQPTMETSEEPALLFSTNFTNIQEDSSSWPWPIDGNVIIIQTEGDALYPNTGISKNKKPMKTGYRNFNAFIRHLLGENTVHIMIGQKNSRTEKSLRELNHAFISMIEQTKVYGGEKRIFFINKFLTWVKFWSEKSPRRKAREKQLRRQSRLIEKITRLENSGYIYADIKISKSELSGEVPEWTLKKIFRYDKAIRENYTIRLCFKLKDYYFGYNTHYAESVAEEKAKNSDTQFHEVMRWDPDLILKKKHIVYMGYSVFDSMMNIDRVSINKFKKLDKNKKRIAKDEELKKKVSKVVTEVKKIAEEKLDKIVKENNADEKKEVQEKKG